MFYFYTSIMTIIARIYKNIEHVEYTRASDGESKGEKEAVDGRWS